MEVVDSSETSEVASNTAQHHNMDNFISN